MQHYNNSEAHTSDGLGAVRLNLIFHGVAEKHLFIVLVFISCSRESGLRVDKQGEALRAQRAQRQQLSSGDFSGKQEPGARSTGCV